MTSPGLGQRSSYHCPLRHPQTHGLSNSELQLQPRLAREPFQNRPGELHQGCGGVSAGPEGKLKKGTPPGPLPRGLPPGLQSSWRWGYRGVCCTFTSPAFPFKVALTG